MVKPEQIRQWFEPKKLYAEKQHFATLSNTFDAEPLVERLRELEPDYARASALEIGPGMNPVAKSAGFGKRTYVDVSQKLARRARSWVDGESGAVVARIEKLPFESDSFHVAIANEVLTHVHPRDRSAAVRNLVRLADKLMIVDRCVTRGADPAKIAEEKAGVYGG